MSSQATTEQENAMQCRQVGGMRLLLFWLGWVAAVSAVFLGSARVAYACDLSLTERNRLRGMAFKSLEKYLDIVGSELTVEIDLCNNGSDKNKCLVGLDGLEKQYDFEISRMSHVVTSFRNARCDKERYFEGESGHLDALVKGREDLRKFRNECRLCRR